MEEEIKKINELYTTQLNKLIIVGNNKYKSILSWRINYKTKLYYLQYTIRWFNTQKTILVNNKTNAIKQIHDKYSNINPNPLKKALLVGINYVNTSSELRGCVNDVNDLKQMLTTKFNYSDANIVTLTESQATRQNILSQLTTLLQSSESGDTLFFSFSGHGHYTRDNSMDEMDGKDELIISVDRYAIVDDELKQIIDSHIKEKVTLFVLVDTCNSGTILDLPYQYFKGEQEMIHHSANMDTKGTVICVSGCRDDQLSMDAYLEGDFNGALTFHFIELLNQHTSLSWKTFMQQLRKKLKKDNFTQIPQITCGTKMDLNSVSVKL